MNNNYPGKNLQESAKNIYVGVIESVMRDIKDMFLDQDLHDDTLELIKNKWMEKVRNSGVLAPPEPAKSANIHRLQNSGQGHRGSGDGITNCSPSNRGATTRSKRTYRH